GQPVRVVDAQAVDEPLVVQAQQHVVGGREDIRRLDLDPDQRGDVEEPPPVRPTVRWAVQSAPGPPRIGSSSRPPRAAQSMSNQCAYREPAPSASTDQNWWFSDSGAPMPM